MTLPVLSKCLPAPDFNTDGNIPPGRQYAGRGEQRARISAWLHDIGDGRDIPTAEPMLRVDHLAG
jgi:hypothetical protein